MTDTTTLKALYDAQTLAQLYAAQGKALPGVSVRAKEYERLGLGKAAFYTGTAEQNTKLLAAEKGALFLSMPEAQKYVGGAENPMPTAVAAAG